ncbi:MULTISPECIES: hypothetical protein [Mycolicibacterium]|uniref:Uncharacterized protein n=1 Tax=Mycolicibacterium senegalense TaxID=1796 RepID=A0A378W9C8_9MYCO|nr:MULTISPECIES: hypothetical protein [Mycolicibacterium]MCV7337217.1 hypothetical protein [Mycolicibacterium senegalense]MDR7287054.1 hypothetical protein [Mycolicibacterium senegalense]QZA24167.1 hypothetical protein K3U95_26670 [Mycolicibacterium senegalense]CDP87930.1 hypothetical protein BN975_03758 [Mycolicibacterium farcinogenes]SUA29369.1 Uncharacterised protein [Mycolicibacterium senegalense]
MEAAQAISLVADWIRSRKLDYPTDGLEADRFEVGWSVYAPVDVDESDPMAFLDMPVGRSIFLVGDSGRIQEVTSSVPPQQARDQFARQELATAPKNAAAPDDASDEAAFMAEFERQFNDAAEGGAPAIADFTVVDTPPEQPADQDFADDHRIAEEASQLLEPIAQQLAQLGPTGWEEFTAEFAFTVSSQIAQLQFYSGDRSGLVPVPQSIADLVQHQREVSARMSAGPWWRLLLNVTNAGEMAVSYDYGDEPFPEDQLVAPEAYRNDLETYPRRQLPVWLAGYVAGPDAQGRDARQAAQAATADSIAGRTATPSEDVPPLHDLLARWAALSAAYAGAGSGWGPRIYPGYCWYESDRRSGSTLFLLPGDRAVLSGGKWNSELLEAAYNGGGQLPDLYTGAPAWVNDAVLNTRNRNGLLSFCFWWVDGQWYRGGTDTSGELDVPIPAIWTPEETVSAMAGQIDPGVTDQCRALLTAATQRNATIDDVAALFSGQSDAKVYDAANQLSLAGLLT